MSVSRLDQIEKGGWASVTREDFAWLVARTRRLETVTEAARNFHRLWCPSTEVALREALAELDKDTEA